MRLNVYTQFSWCNQIKFKWIVSRYFEVAERNWMIFLRFRAEFHRKLIHLYISSLPFNHIVISKLSKTDHSAAPNTFLFFFYCHLITAFRGYIVRRKYGPLLTANGTIDINTCRFIRQYAKKWKARTIFQTLLLYRAAKYQDLVNLSQQVKF